MEMHRIEVIERKRAAILAAKTPDERIMIGSIIHREICSRLQELIVRVQPDIGDEERHFLCLRTLHGDEVEEYIASRQREGHSHVA